MPDNLKLTEWVAEMAALCGPDRVVWLDGSEEEKRRLEGAAVASGELTALDPARFPGCFYHRTEPRDMARTEHLTFVCSKTQAEAGPTNDWLSPEDGRLRGSTALKGSMKGRTMYAIPFSLGPVGSAFSKIGVQLTDSICVCLSMRIMTRIGAPVLAALGQGADFIKCLHGNGGSGPDRSLILHFPEDDAVWAVGAGTGAGILADKKCLSLRVPSWQARREGWLAEHMLILGIEDPWGRVEYVTAAFPSACGKTNLAMLIPPDGLRSKGYKVWTVGDDVAWLRVGADGRLWAVNPEAGFSGVAPGTNSRSNPNALATARRNAIFTNVVLGDDKSVWWEDGEGAPPASGTDWQGRPWKPGMKDANGRRAVGAHPNGRFTAPLSQCPSASPQRDAPEGVPVSAIIFGSRRARLAPLVYQTFDWDHGVYTGATVASERTPAADGKAGEVRRDPMAMLPFCGYDMADYFTHWMQMGRRIPSPPKVFQVNWFRRGDRGEFLWPGRGENLRVLEWVLARCRGAGKARQTPIGWVPTPDALDLSGLELPAGAVDELLAVDIDGWMAEVAEHRRFFSRFEGRLGPDMAKQQALLEERLAACVGVGK